MPFVTEAAVPWLLCKDEAYGDRRMSGQVQVQEESTEDCRDNGLAPFMSS